MSKREYTNDALGKVIRQSKTMIQYDENAKKVVANKHILAEILAESAEEFKNVPHEEIIALIEGEPEVSQIPVNPGETNNPFITGLSNESKIPYEGTITYDVRFYIYTPDKKNRIKIIVDVEVQKTYNPGYDLVTRGILYGARMLSEQVDKEFSIPNYNDIKKVYSIWVCMNSPQYAENTITLYNIQQTDMIGHFPKVKSRYDLLTVVMIRLPKEVSGKEFRLHRLLSTIFSPKMKYNEKRDIIEQEYEIALEGDFERSVNVMCNLSEAVWAEAMDEGMAQGMAKGIEKGQEKLAQLIKLLINSERIADIKLVTEDKNYRDQLLKEYHLD